MTIATYTMEQIRANWNEAQRRILPAVLEPSVAQEISVSNYMLEQKMEPTPENFVLAYTRLYKSLRWKVKPAALIRDESAHRPATITPAQTQQNDFSARVREGEARDAKKKADQEAFKRIESAIAAYTPVERGRIMYAKQSEQQTRLRQYVAQQVGRNADPAGILTQVEKEISRLYSEAERKAEKI
jgi:hypothetical protein